MVKDVLVSDAMMSGAMVSCVMVCGNHETESVAGNEDLGVGNLPLGFVKLRFHRIGQW